MNKLASKQLASKQTSKRAEQEASEASKSKQSKASGQAKYLGLAQKNGTLRTPGTYSYCIPRHSSSLSRATTNTLPALYTSLKACYREEARKKLSQSTHGEIRNSGAAYSTVIVERSLRQIGIRA